MKHRLIIVIGNIGSGKSTLTDLLAEAMPAERIPADSLYMTNPFFPLAVENRQRWSLTSDLWFLRERVEMSRQIPKLLKKSHVVVDSGLPMSYVYAHSRLHSGYFLPEEWRLYQTYHDELIGDIQKPDLIIYSQASVPFLHHRIQTRGRDFEIKLYDDKYLATLNASLETMVLTAQKANLNVLKLKAEEHNFLENKAEVTQLVASILN